jgi:hypothetical protein
VKRKKNDRERAIARAQIFDRAAALGALVGAYCVATAGVSTVLMTATDISAQARGHGHGGGGHYHGGGGH